MYKKVVTLLLLPLLWAGLLMLSHPVLAAADPDTAQGTVLRVAIPIPAYGGEDASSSAYIGYTEEYLDEISQYTGWQYELIAVPGDYEGGLQDALNMLQEGTVDLIAPIAADDVETTADVYYSQSSYLTTTLELQIPNAIYAGETLEDNVRVAMIRESGQQASADAFFARNQITPQYVLCRNVSEQIELVMSGQADMMLNSALEYVPDATVIAHFDPQELFLAAADPVLIRELDQAYMSTIQSNVFFTQELYEKYMIDGSAVLTKAETAFIEQSAPYVVAVLDNNAPHQDVDDDTDTFSGIGVDLLRHISETTGLQFQFVGVESLDALRESLAAGEAQIAIAVSDQHELVTERKLVLTRTYATCPYVLISFPSFPGPGSGQRLAMTSEGISISGGNQIGAVQQYATNLDCLEAILDGEADYTYMDLYNAQYYLGDSRYAGLRMETQSYTPHEVSFGIASPANPNLLSILNKSLNRLSDAEIQHFISQNVNPERQFTLRSLIRDYPIHVLLTVIIVSLVVAGLLLLLLWRKEKHRKALHKKAMEDGMTRLYNAVACRRLVTQKLHQMPPDQIGAFLIMDMDNFKQINDGFGHQEGDRVIQDFADLLRDVLRADSIIARIGGDEFVAFLPSVKEEQNIRSICARIQTRAHSICVGERPITISIGAVMAKAGDDYDTLYYLSDHALYQAKNQQKDQFCFASREF